MKKLLLYLLLLTTLPACRKETFRPNILFSPGAAYVSSDKTVSRNETLVVGIRASKTTAEDGLQLFTATVSYDDADASILRNIELNNTESDTYALDMPITTRNKKGTEVYTFSVTTKDGLTNMLTLTLQVR